MPIFCRFPKSKFAKFEFVNFYFAKFEFAKFEFEFTKFEFAKFKFAKFEFAKFEFPQFEFAKFKFPKFNGIKMVQLFCDVSVFLQPTRGKEVLEKVRKKFQQSQEVCALIRYTCYPLLCLLDLWSTFEKMVEKDHHILLKCLLLTIRNRLSFNNTGNLVASQHLHRICACFFLTPSLPR